VAHRPVKTGVTAGDLKVRVADSRFDNAYQRLTCSFWNWNISEMNIPVFDPQGLHSFRRSKKIP
jgi:hypothetical protein